MMRFWKFIVATTIVAFASAPSSAWIHGIAYTFNGGKSQLNMGLLGLNECPFINMAKCVPAFAVDPSILDVNGYPTSGAYNSVISLPDQENLTRNVLVTWIGNGVLSPSSGSVVSGSINPVQGGDGIYRGRYIYTPSGSSVKVGMASQSSPAVSQLVVMYADLETTYNNGEMFDPQAINIVRNTLRAGTVRFLNWQGFSSGANNSNVTTWESEKSESYFSYAAGEFRNVAATGRPALWAGSTTHSGQDYSITFGSGGPSDKQMIQLKFDASATQTTTSLGTLSTAFPGAVSSAIVVHWPAHGFSGGEPVGFIGSTGTPLPGPMGSGINYYVTTIIDADNFNISLTSGGSNLVKTSSGTAGSTINAIRMPTLNLNSAGVVPIRTNAGDPGGQFGGTQPTTGKLNTLVYDADMASWMLWSGSVDLGGIINGVPPSVMLQFCKEVGAHCWFVTPFMAADPMTNWASSLASYMRANKPPWMKVRVEGVNELWNSGAAFLGTRYAWNKAFIHWGTSFDVNNWYGKIISTIGQDVQTTFASDTTQYDVMGCVQASTGDSPTADNDRFNSTQYVAQSAPAQSGYLKQAAYRYVTQGCEAMYVQSAYYGFPPELSYAYDYAVNGNATALQNYVDGMVVNTGSSSTRSNQNLINTGTRYSNLGTYFAGPWGGSFVLGMMAYEGAANAIPATASNSTAGITGATQANPVVLTLPTSLINGNQNGSAASNSPTPSAMVGMSLSISGVVGMTQLNGNTYTVSAINVGADPTKVAINVDGTAFSTYVSSGTAVYVSATSYLNTLRSAYRLHPSMQNYTYGGATSNYQNWLNAGGTWPSHFDFSSANSPWALYQPDDYTLTPSPQAIGIHNFNTNWLLKRDLDPASNDNDPMWLEKAA